MTWIMYAVLPTFIDVIIVKHKRNKTIKKIKEKLDEKGYIVDEKAKKRIPKFVIKNYFKEDYAKSDWALDISLSYLPIIRLLLIFSNISYLCGNYEGDNKIYKVLEDIVSESDDIAALENKYNKVNDYTKLNISNDIDSLKEKRKILDNMKKLKNNEQRKDNVESDALLLEYKPSKKNNN